MRCKDTDDLDISSRRGRKGCTKTNEQVAPSCVGLQSQDGVELLRRGQVTEIRALCVSRGAPRESACRRHWCATPRTHRGKQPKLYSHMRARRPRRLPKTRRRLRPRIPAVWPADGNTKLWTLQLTTKACVHTTSRQMHKTRSTSWRAQIGQCRFLHVSGAKMGAARARTSTTSIKADTA